MSSHELQPPHDLVHVGRIGSAHGLHGEVFVYLTTDDPAGRFEPGSRLWCLPARRKRGAASQDALETPFETVVESVRLSHRKGKASDAAAGPAGLFVKLDACATREDGQALHGWILGAPPQRDPADPDSFYPDDLKGMDVVDEDGATLGTVRDVIIGGAQDLLVVSPAEPRNEADGANQSQNSGAPARRRSKRGPDVLVPFVRQIVHHIDVDNDKILCSPPEGLFDAES